MRVGFMGRSIRPGATGVGRYAANLVDALAEALPARSLTLFLTRQGPHYGNGRVREVRAPFPTPHESWRALWEQTLVPAQAAALGLDVYHSPNYILPLALSCPAVVTIHDCFYLEPGLHRMRSHLYLSFLTALAIRRARAVVAVSDFTRRAIEARYPHAAGRVEVISEAVDPELRPPSSGELRSFCERLGFEQPYVLFLGTLEPRKNLVRLVQAFELAAQEERLPHHLVLAGPRGWRIGELDAAIQRSPLRHRIHRPGYVAEKDLPCWYAAADLFVYPSLAEGFGLPPLEAMAIGTPVVTSNASSLPEVVGDAALTVPPADTTALASAMVRVLSDRSLAHRLRCAGLQQVQRFSWQHAAQRYVAVYERTAAGRRP